MQVANAVRSELPEVGSHGYYFQLGCLWKGQHVTSCEPSSFPKTRAWLLNLGVRNSQVSGAALTMKSRAMVSYGLSSSIFGCRSIAADTVPGDRMTSCCGVRYHCSTPCISSQAPVTLRSTRWRPVLAVIPHNDSLGSSSQPYPRKSQRFFTTGSHASFHCMEIRDIQWVKFIKQCLQVSYP